MTSSEEGISGGVTLKNGKTGWRSLNIKCNMEQTDSWLTTVGVRDKTK